MRVRVLVVPIVALTLAAACGGDSKKSGTGTGAGTATSAPLTGNVTVFNAMEPSEAAALQKVVDQLITAKVGYKATIEASSQFEEQIKIRVQGVCPTDVDLANFMTQLSAVPFFDAVNNTYARERAENNRVMREFELTFSVNLTGAGS